MSRKEQILVKEFKQNYPKLCEGKDDKTILVYIRFIDATRNEIRTQESLRQRFETAMVKVLDMERAASRAM